MDNFRSYKSVHKREGGMIVKVLRQLLTERLVNLKEKLLCRDTLLARVDGSDTNNSPFLL